MESSVSNSSNLFTNESCKYIPEKNIMYCEKDQQSSSDSEEFIEKQNITVKFQISESQIVAQIYPNCITIAEIKHDIGKKFNICPLYLVITQCDEELSDKCRLYDTCRNEYGIVEFILKISDTVPLNSDGQKPELDLQVYYNKFRLNDFITVHIPPDPTVDCECASGQDVIVEIQNKAIEKPFLGGYRDVKTGIEYHDAFTQTGPPLERIRTSGIVSRDVQTVHLRSKSMETPYDRSTQAFGDGTKLIHVSAASDYVIYPKRYESYCEIRRRENKISKIILLQRNIRRWILWRFIKRWAAEYRRLVEEQNRRNDKILDKYVDKFQKECITKTFPRTKDDFDVLFAQVQKWKKAEVKRINAMYSDGPRIAELNCLLDKEIQLLNGIEAQRNLVRKALRDYRENKVLEKLGEPVKWIGYRDIVVEMDLLRTQRVRYLHGLHKDLKMITEKEERLKLINRISEILESQEHYEDIAELMDLFEREKDLLICSKSCDLEILRKRQLVLFYDIIKKEKEYKPKQPETLMCETCQTVKPVKDFALRTRQSNLNTCKHCYYLKGSSSDNSIFKAILRAVQRDERKRGTLSSYAFIMQEDDMRFLVEKIWHGHSILSKCNDITDLRMLRWIISDEWSPWNTICLTEAEARVHIRLKDLKEIYDDALIQDIKTKNLNAKTMFKKLQEVDRNFVQTGKWWEVGVKDKVI